MGGKTDLLAAIVARLEAELSTLTAAAHSARDEATDAESRQEGKYDMRAQTAAYLAAGQAKLAAELAEAIAAYRGLPTGQLPPQSPATLGALLTVEAAGQRTLYFLGPARGGLEVEWNGAAVTVITPSSPLGRQVLGRRAGDILDGRRKLVLVE